MKRTRSGLNKSPSSIPSFSRIDSNISFGSLLDAELTAAAPAAAAAAAPPPLLRTAASCRSLGSQEASPSKAAGSKSKSTNDLPSFVRVDSRELRSLLVGLPDMDLDELAALGPHAEMRRTRSQSAANPGRATGAAAAGGGAKGTQPKITKTRSGSSGEIERLLRGEDTVPPTLTRTDTNLTGLSGLLYDVEPVEEMTTQQPVAAPPYPMTRTTSELVGMEWGVDRVKARTRLNAMAAARGAAQQQPLQVAAAGPLRSTPYGEARMSEPYAPAAVRAVEPDPTDIYSGKMVVMVRGKYKGRRAFVQRKVKKKWSLQVEGVQWGLEFYDNMFSLTD